MEGLPGRSLDAGLGGGGVQDRPLVGQLELAQRRSSFGAFGLGGRFEHAGRVEVADLEPLPGYRAHGTSQASTSDTRTAQNPLSTRGKSIVTYL